MKPVAMKPVAVLLSSVLLLAGCTGSSDDESSPEPSPVDASRSLDSGALDQQAEDQADQNQAAQTKDATVVDVVIRDGKVTPQGKRVEVGDNGKVVLTVTSDVAEEVHVHSDPEHTYQVPAGGTITKTFTLTTPGQVAVEAHELGVTIVQLVVR